MVGLAAHITGFNTQPPEGGWPTAGVIVGLNDVSTHSRPKAAGAYAWYWGAAGSVSTHSRPKAAGRRQ